MENEYGQIHMQYIIIFITYYVRTSLMSLTRTSDAK